MLLHIGGFETVMLARLLELLEGLGFELVSLPDAQGDPAHAVDPDQALPAGATFLDQMRIARRLPRPDAPPDDTLAKLSALCR
jgi:hypothetical protein